MRVEKLDIYGSFLENRLALLHSGAGLGCLRQCELTAGSAN